MSVKDIKASLINKKQNRNICALFFGSRLVYFDLVRIFGAVCLKKLTINLMHLDASKSAAQLIEPIT